HRLSLISLNAPSPSVTCTLSLHDALPIWTGLSEAAVVGGRVPGVDVDAGQAVAGLVNDLADDRAGALRERDDAVGPQPDRLGVRTGRVWHAERRDAAGRRAVLPVAAEDVDFVGASRHPHREDAG